MSKKITPLEALNEIKNHLSELHKEINNDPFIHLYEILPFLVIQKSLKVLDIIKERNIDVSLIKNTKNYDEYCDDFAMKVLLLKDERFFVKNKGITQEEYDLLKEVLL